MNDYCKILLYAVISMCIFLCVFYVSTPGYYGISLQYPVVIVTFKREKNVEKNATRRER